jgi:hypothetical protein
MKNSKWFNFGRLALLAFGLATQTSRAVILFGSGDPAYNTTPPTGALANSGWQYEGQWGGFLGTPIAPQYFIAAHHVGGGIGGTFIFNGVSYTTTAYWDDLCSDLRVWKVDGTFPIYAPIYTNSDEAGKMLVNIGRGTQRGASVVISKVQTNCTTNTVDLSALGISPVDAKKAFPNAKVHGPTMSVVSKVPVMHVVDLKALRISPKDAKAEFPDATIKGNTMTVVTSEAVTNEVDLTGVNVSMSDLRSEFPDATFHGQTMTVVTSEVVTNEVLKGWQDGPGDGVMRWGVNRVSGIGSLLVAAFTGTYGPNEAYLSSGDSSGAVFVQDNTGVWKLAGLNYGIEGPFSSTQSGSAFYGAIFDESNLYEGGCFIQDCGSPQPVRYYATRISPRVAWIQSIISR